MQQHHTLTALKCTVQQHPSLFLNCCILLHREWLELKTSILPENGDISHLFLFRLCTHTNYCRHMYKVCTKCIVLVRFMQNGVSGHRNNVATLYCMCANTTLLYIWKCACAQTLYICLTVVCIHVCRDVSHRSKYKWEISPFSGKILCI